MGGFFNQPLAAGSHSVSLCGVLSHELREKVSRKLIVPLEETVVVAHQGEAQDKQNAFICSTHPVFSTGLTVCGAVGALLPSFTSCLQFPSVHLSIYSMD